MNIGIVIWTPYGLFVDDDKDDDVDDEDDNNGV